MSMVFLADIPPHHCRVPFLNSSYGGLGYNLSIPTEELKGETILSRCRRYSEQEDSDAAYGNDTEGCLDGWLFSKERYVSTIVTETIFSVIQAASTSWEMFSVLYFIVGMGQIANYCSAFVIGSELLSKSCRISFSTLGISLTYIPESPRWLLSHGRVEEAEAIIRAAAKMNGITPPDVIFKRDDTAKLMDSVGVQKSYTWIDLFRTVNIRNTTLINIIIWITVALTYYGLSLNTPNMDGDPYLNCLVAACSEVVGYTFTWVAARYISRRLTMSLPLFVCGALLLIIKFVPEELHALTTTLVMIGKTCVTGAFGFLYLYCTELFRTVVRNMGLGVTSMASRIGSTISPYVAYIGTYNKVLPYILMGVFSLITGVLGIMLPETKDEELPELISQVRPLQW
ncbi:hypothetical protein ACEWY4_027164 [Coilia grayii]|uniref:Major facilitator superfamily (MFS) profile domain-containing protein n=1 Tax=Coilia grayii TaxID=363190 RepID=A0ABD1IRP1_9TELE